MFRTLSLLSLVCMLLLSSSTWAQEPPASPLLEKQRKVLKELFSDGLVNSANEKIEIASLEGKLIGIYFGASWSGPCMEFSPALLRQQKLYRKDFDIVFVSSDDNAAAMNAHHLKLPYAAVPFGSNSAKALKKKYGVIGIPTLVILNDDGSLQTVEGRGLISSRANLRNLRANREVLPTPPAAVVRTQVAPKLNLAETFKTGLVDAENRPVAPSVFEGKTIGFYFSASWCGPCRRFTPVLMDYHEKYSDDFELVFVSSDRSRNTYDAYRKSSKIDCLAIDFGHASIEQLTQRYRIRNLPALVLLNEKGELITTDARYLVQTTKPLNMQDLNRGTVEVFNCSSCTRPHYRPAKR